MYSVSVPADESLFPIGLGRLLLKDLRMPKEESTTPLMTLLAESAIASTCCSTRPRMLPSAGANGLSSVTGLLVKGIGVRSAVLYEGFQKKKLSESNEFAKQALQQRTSSLFRYLPIPIQPYQHFPKIQQRPSS